ncbi:hypothetical protein [Sphingomicrobium marinum]|uniref:hypothetical protein n=1 Tax=Sphingomicrobium marinum TaxID=1227950 RepID=UPI002240275F|nr:hypothetical protein [Sphingomicrobium marinum]
MLFVSLIGLSACELFEPDRWEGFVYPNQHNLADWQAIGTYETFEQCRAAAQSRIQSLDEPDNATFECGLNCRGSIYEETRD